MKFIRLSLLSIMSAIYMMGDVRGGDFELIDYKNLVYEREFKRINKTE